MEGKDASAAPPAGAPQPAAPAPPAAGQPQPQPQPPEAARWGTRQMGPPAAPGAHPENQEAARGTAARGDQELPPYVIVGEPVAALRQKGDSPMEHILDFFNAWSRKAEELASNIWFNRKASLPSRSCSVVSSSALFRSISLTARAEDPLLFLVARAERGALLLGGQRILCFAKDEFVNARFPFP